MPAPPRLPTLFQKPEKTKVLTLVFLTDYPLQNVSNVSPMQAIKDLSKRPSFHVILTSVPQIVASLGRAVLKNDRIIIKINAKIVTPMNPAKNCEQITDLFHGL